MFHTQSAWPGGAQAFSLGDGLGARARSLLRRAKFLLALAALAGIALDWNSAALAGHRKKACAGTRALVRAAAPSGASHEQSRRSPPDVAALVAGLSDPDPLNRMCSFLELGRAGPAAADAVPDLIQRLRGTDSVWAAFALGEIGGERAVPALVDAVGSGNDEVAVGAITALARVGAPAVPRLVASAAGAAGSAYFWHVSALGSVGRGCPLHSYLDTTDVVAKSYIAIAMAQSGEPNLLLLHVLREAMGSPKEEVRRAAAMALAGLGETSDRAQGILADAAKRGDPGTRWRAAKAAGAAPLGGELAVTLAEMMDRDPDAKARIWAAYSFVASCEPLRARALAALTAHLEVQDDSVRCHAILALGLLGSKAETASHRLCEIAQGDNLLLAMGALDSIGRLGVQASDCLPALARLVREDGGTLRIPLPLVAKAIARVDPQYFELEVAPLLLRMLGSDDANQRRAAIDALTRVSTANPNP